MPVDNGPDGLVVDSVDVRSKSYESVATACAFGIRPGAWTDGPGSSSFPLHPVAAGSGRSRAPDGTFVGSHPASCPHGPMKAPTRTSRLRGAHDEMPAFRAGRRGSVCGRIWSAERSSDD